MSHTLYGLGGFLLTASFAGTVLAHIAAIATVATGKILVSDTKRLLAAVLSAALTSVGRALPGWCVRQPAEAHAGQASPPVGLWPTAVRPTDAPFRSRCTHPD